MSVAQNIKDRVFGRPTVKVEIPPVAPPAPAQPPPAFLSANLKTDTDSFILVSGAYNFAVVKGFAQPVVALMGDWKPEYALMFPFTQAKRIEVVISRIPPELTPGAQDCNPEATSAAASSANLDTNIGFLFSLIRSGWAREHCILCNAGVAQCAQERFESHHFPSHRDKYLRRFTKLGDIRSNQIPALRAPPVPARPLNAPMLRPARQVCKNQAHWDALPESEKARMIAEEESQWMNKYAPAWGNSRRVIDIDIPAPPPSFDERTSTDGWKQPPNASERESIERDDWK